MHEPSRSSLQAQPITALLGRELNEAEQRHAAEHLFVEGDRELLAPWNVRVSLVGSRKASEEGLRRARKLAKILVGEGIIVVSGLAAGIDTAAHRATLEAGGRTIGVLGTGIDRYYPKQNQSLQREIARRHLLVSQFPLGSPPKRHAFPLRNRTMALISDATVIVEASDGSGSLHQGWEALRLARPLFLLRSNLEKDLAWPRKLMSYGALVLREPDDLLVRIPTPDSEPTVAFAF